ncbi:uncharacterized protein C10orf67, mitochondrial-like isoform X4 [Bolinopsis microptera]|uniref:uncharacterized protein C10orf67, mitochondrial-like isoform X4 n=1 Tax=Bolinopsis microptera TaxID=2820187 RepID=UPI00307A6179
MGEQPDNVSESANEETTSPAAISVDTMERLKTCPGFVEVDPRLLQVFADSITMNNDVGYFLKDIACQTEESSITDLNDMIKIIQNLLKEITVVKRNLLFAKQLLHADYDAKVGGRAMDLYCSINDRLAELEKLYEERMRVARRSYKTQMADACKKIAGDYKRYYMKMLELETGQSGSVLQELRDTISKQGKMLKLQEQNMSALRTQLLEAENRVLDEHFSVEDSEASLKAETPPPPPEPDFLTNAIDPDEHKKVVEEKEKLEKRCSRLADEVTDVQSKHKRIEARLKLVRTEAEEEKTALEHEIKGLKEETNTLKDENEKLVLKSQQVKKVAFVDSSASPTPPVSPAPVVPVVQGNTATSAEIEARIKDEVQKARTEMMIKFKKENELIAAQSKDSLKAEQEKRQYAERLLQSQQDLSSRDSGKLALRHLQQLEEEQRTEIARLNKELDRTTCIYEKKLSVLHSTMINLKNEVFMRNLLHRQAAQLHHATLSYASDSPAMTAYLAPHEHSHKKFPERLAPFKSHPRPPTAFTESSQEGSDDKHISTFLTEHATDETRSDNTLNISTIVK